MAAVEHEGPLPLEQDGDVETQKRERDSSNPYCNEIPAVDEERSGEDGPGNPSGRHCRQPEHEQAESAEGCENENHARACRLRLGGEASS